MQFVGNKKKILRDRRAVRVRKKLRGTKEKPRFSVRKTNKHIILQIIDDEAGQTLASASTLEKEMKATPNGKKCVASAQKLGEVIAERALKNNVKTVVFDRGFSKYHGVLKALADAAREKGLQF